jgi:putative membrane fusion protein
VDILELDEIEETIKVKAVIIKDEEVVYSDSTGNINYHYNEGQKVNGGAHLIDLIGTENKKIFSPKSGFVTYVFDGLESSFKFDEVLNIMPSSLQNIEETIENTVNINTANSGDKLLKVINNFEYYMACLVSNVDISTYEQGKYIRVRFEDYDKMIYGQIKKINTGNDGSVLIIGFDDFFHKVYNKRIIEASLIKNLYEGIKVDKRAVVEKDEIKGVYIKDVSNIIKFVPIEIIGGNDKHYIVSPGETMKEGSRGTINVNDVIYYTVKVFDKLVLKPDKVYEGQIVD